jgi:hypothetical protein
MHISDTVAEGQSKLPNSHSSEISAACSKPHRIGEDMSPLAKRKEAFDTTLHR